MNQELDPLTLTRRLGPLLEAGEAPLAMLGLDAATLRGLGFDVEGAVARIPADVERLDAAGIRARLDERASGWLKDLEVLEVTGSTSALLNEMAGRQSVDGVVRLAELQVQGRGRRGRSWASPYASNLALSLGARLPQSPDLLGGFSLCVGLAVADRLSTAGVPGIELKWPNDVLARGRKIAGILIDLHGAGSGTEVVVGIGLNFHLPSEVRSGIDQPVTDLQALGGRWSRNELAAGLISSLVDFLRGFATQGFAPMTRVFDQMHRFHGRTCTLIMGGERLTGTVRGVSESGELRLEIDGRIRSFHSGEVSLRPN